jgi:hypothetical protein
MAILKNEPVERPALSFYEIGGFAVDPYDSDKYNIYNSPSWKPLLDLAENHTDIIRLVSPVRAQSHLSWTGTSGETHREFVEVKKWEENNSRFIRLTYKIAGKKLTSLSRRDREIDTVWITEPLLKNTDDVKLFLKLPDEIFSESLNISHLEKQERELGNKGIVMVDTEDPICAVASLFNLETFTVFALTENKLCHELLEKHARYIHKRTWETAIKFPGRLWRIYGPEYVTEPFLPPYLFNEYVVKYTGPMVEMIKKNGGFVRIHSHGRIKNVIDYIAAMGTDGIDPVEPPPHGDMELLQVRKEYGKQLIIFGNIEVTDIENLDTGRFRKVVRKTISEGTYGEGRGFVLMPTASPYGRDIPDRTLRNYEIMVEEIEHI